MPLNATHTDRVLAHVDAARDELVELTRRLIRIPTVNPPGEEYDACARVIGERLEQGGMSVEYIEAVGRPEHTEQHPRINVIGRLEGAGPRPCLHLNGHVDVVPAGEGWTVDPFEAVIREGRIVGRGASDMKSGLAAAVVAVEAVRRSGVPLRGSIDLSATVDEESGGLAGVAHLCESGRVTGANTDFAIIPEPFGPERICVGHKGVYWCDVVASGRIAHGSMPHLGHSAIDDVATLLEALRTELAPRLQRRVTELPVVPDAARASSINVNAIQGGQRPGGPQTPCVADRCVATLDRRFIPEESLDDVRAEIEQLVRRVEEDHPDRSFTIEERLAVHPVRAPSGSPVTTALARAVREVRGVDPELVASPGTYDHKHFARMAGVEHCVAYGPGPLREAHQPDESCSIGDLIASAQVLALAILELVG